LLRIFREITGGLTPQILANSACLTSAIGVLLIDRGRRGGQAGFRAEFRPGAAGGGPVGRFWRRSQTGRGWRAAGGPILAAWPGRARPAGRFWRRGQTGRGRWAAGGSILPAWPGRSRPVGGRGPRFWRYSQTGRGWRVDYRSHTKTIRRAGGAS